MISFAIATALYATSMQAAAMVPRKQFSDCLNRTIKKSLSEKTAPDSFTTAVRTACAAQETAFKKALVDYDVKAGIRRAQAEEDAQFQIDGYVENAVETYKVHFEGGTKPDE